MAESSGTTSFEEVPPLLPSMQSAVVESSEERTAPEFPELNQIMSLVQGNALSVQSLEGRFSDLERQRQAPTASAGA